MYREHDRRTVHRMHAKGMSKAAIARALGMSRNTVDKLLKLHEAPVFARKDALTKKEELAIQRLARALVSTAEPFAYLFGSRTSGADGTLRILRCRGCDFYIHPPGPVCPRCLSSRVEPRPVGGRGRVHSYTVNFQPWRPELADPYVIAVVELEEQQGLRLLSNIVGCPVEDVAIGMEVEVTFEAHGDVYLPFFRPTAR